LLRNDRRSGATTFTALLTKRAGSHNSLTAFDLPRLDGADLRPAPARRAARMRLLPGADGMLFSQALAVGGAVVFAKVCELSLEGTVSKRAGRLYRSGPSRA
jgi:ATP-dependent DNA ligase